MTAADESRGKETEELRWLNYVQQDRKEFLNEPIEEARSTSAETEEVR
jgi:hypothetical protein